MTLDNIIILIQTALLVGVLYSFLTLGLSLSFRVLNYPDLTLEGSMIIGGAISYYIISQGINPFLSLLFGGIAGMLAGFFTAIQNIYLKVGKLLSGIITTAIIYSLTIRVLAGRSNARFNEGQSIFSILNPSNNTNITIMIIMVILLCLTLFLTYYFKTKSGMLLRAAGGNERFLISYGKNPKIYTFVGLGLANAVIGLGGAILVNFKNTVDINMSFGLLVSALAAMVIGETIINAHKMWHGIIGNIIGTIIYNLAIGIFLFSWDSQNDSFFIPSDVRMITGLLLIIPILIKNKKTDRFNLFNSEW
ncbi:MAG: hypothetical protein C4517_09290 [Stygiobacter sp.]|nr:MAG: hypothetical protein C4517_09290 [Stygiobacter sp.]